MRAKTLGIEVEVVHNASIMNAVGACGLQLYRFGEAISIPFFTDTWRPDSFYDKIKANRTIGLHTLCLLGTASITYIGIQSIASMLNVNANTMLAYFSTGSLSYVDILSSLIHSGTFLDVRRLLLNTVVNLDLEYICVCDNRHPSQGAIRRGFV